MVRRLDFGLDALLERLEFARFKPQVLLEQSP